VRIDDQAQARKVSRVSRVSLVAVQPDAAGTATRLAAESLRRARVPLQPLLKKAGLSEFQITSQEARIGVASQIAFLELAAAALRQPLLAL
jgi:hypothetical protein